MWKTVAIIVVVGCSVVYVACFMDSMIGPGRWLVLDINQCDNPDQYEFKVDISRKKLNRTHDCFNGKWHFPKDIDSSYGILIEAYKQVDGGFKYYTSLSDDCVCTYIMKYAKENTVEALMSAGVEPPDCPVAMNDYELENFVMDYSKLREDGIYGTFEVYAYMTLEEHKVTCSKLLLNFEKRAANDDDVD